MKITEYRHLVGWDWRAELARQERSVIWLARRTGRHQQTVYRYAWGLRTAPAEWLAQAAIVLGVMEDFREMDARVGTTVNPHLIGTTEQGHETAEGPA